MRPQGSPSRPASLGCGCTEALASPASCLLPTARQQGPGSPLSSEVMRVSSPTRVSQVPLPRNLPPGTPAPHWPPSYTVTLPPHPPHCHANLTLPTSLQNGTARPPDGCWGRLGRAAQDGGSKTPVPWSTRKHASCQVYELNIHEREQQQLPVIRTFSEG